MELNEWIHGYMGESVCCTLAVYGKIISCTAFLFISGAAKRHALRYNNKVHQHKHIYISLRMSLTILIKKA